MLVPQYLLEAKTGRDFPPAITHPEFYYGFIGVTIAWQILFLLLSSNPARYRPLMIPAVLEKAGFVIAIAVLFFLEHRVASLMLAPATIDLVFGVLFIASYFKTAAHETVPD